MVRTSKSSLMKELEVTLDSHEKYIGSHSFDELDTVFESLDDQAKELEYELEQANERIEKLEKELLEANDKIAELEE